jgi:hypothetical protein
MLPRQKLLAIIAADALGFSPQTHNYSLGAQLIAPFERTNRSGAPYLRTGPKGILNAHI